MKTLKITLIILISYSISFSQSITQSITGKIFDNLTREPLPFANIVVLDTDPLIGTTSDLEGNFIIKKIPVGRHNIKVTMMGYESRLLNELLISTGQQPVLNIGLQQTVLNMGSSCCSSQQGCARKYNDNREWSAIYSRRNPALCRRSG